MAQAIKSENITPADELRALITQSEKRVVNLDSSASAITLLLDMDRIRALWPELEAQGVDLRAELGRWETLQAEVQNRAAALVRKLRAAGGLPAARGQHHPDDEAAWWWFLAEDLQARRVRRWRRTGAIVGATAAIATLLYFLIFRVLFPADPNVTAALAARNAGEKKITAEDDVAGALADFRRVTELQPDDAENWLWLGCVQLRLADPAGAAESFGRAEMILADEVNLRLARAPICSMLGLNAEAEADLQAVLAKEPENALAYYYLASIFEERAAFQEAIAALERAAELADNDKQAYLVAMSRYRMGMLMQQMTGQDLQGPTPTP